MPLSDSLRRSAPRHRATSSSPTRRRKLIAAIALPAILTLALPSSAASALASDLGGPPMGHVDVVQPVSGGIHLEGWAWDPDTTAPVTVVVTAAGSTTSVTASNSRPDVERAFPEAGSARGFSVDLATGSGPQEVCVTAKNVGAGHDKNFGCRTVTVPSGSPRGNFDGAVATDSGVELWGWAADPDTTEPLTVRVSVAGTSHDLVTAAPRPDVERVYPAFGGTTGFKAEIAAPPGIHDVCVTALNVGPGRDRTFACRSVSVGPAEPVVTPEPTPPPTEPVVEPQPAPAPAPTEPVVDPQPSPAPETGVPGPGNTGVPAGTALRVHDGDLTITTPGTVVDGLDIRGYLRIKAANVTVKNSVIRGRSGLVGSMALIQNSSPGVVIQDVEVAATYPSYYVDGFVGSNATFIRVNIHSVVDSIKIIGDDVTVQDSWLHDNLYYASVPSGGDTHNDNIQIQRGSNITIRDNVMSGTRNAAMMVTQDAGPVSDLTFTGNQADGGSCTVNVAEKSYGPLQGVSVTGNVFGLNSINRCAIIMPPTTSSIADTTGNVFTDGTAVTVTRG